MASDERAYNAGTMEWLALVGFLLLCSFAYAAWSAAPWVPTKKQDVERVEALLNLKPGEEVYVSIPDKKPIILRLED